MNWLLLKNSLLVSGSATLLAVSLGFIAALWLAGLAPRWRNLFLAVAIIALALPPFLVTNCWLDLLGYTGAWRSWLPLNIFSLGGTAWILGLLLWPIPLLAVSSAWRRLEPSQLESDMAVTGWTLVRGVLFPLARCALAQAAVLTFVLALNNFAVPAILQVKVFPAEMWVRFNTTFDVPGALQLSWPLVAGPLLLLLWLSRREIPWPHLEAPVSAKLFRQQLGPAWFWFCGPCVILLCFLAVGIPLLQLISAKRTWTELPGALAAGQTAVWNSFWFAAASATAVVTLGLTLIRVNWRNSRITFRPSVFGILMKFGVWSLEFSWLLWLPFLVPGVLLGIALITLLNRPWSAFCYQSAGIVILAFVIRYLGLGWNTVAHAHQTVDRDLIDVARLEGATRWQMFLHVHWPQIAPQVVAVWYIVFLLCLWDVESMILVVPPGGETLALRAFNLLHYGHNAQVNALCLTLLALALAPLFLYQAYSLFRVHVSRITHHASRITLLAATLLLTSCTPSRSSHDAPLQSQLFSRVEIIGARGVGVGQLNKPRSVAVDAQDNLFVVDMTGRVQKFSPDGAFLLSWQMPQTDLGKPKGLCRDRDGNILVLEPHYQRVNHYSPDGKLLARWGEKGTNTGQLAFPRAVAVNSHNAIFVSEYMAVERVQKFSPLAPINTPLQRGDTRSLRELNRFSGFDELLETAEAVQPPTERTLTPLKRGVNDSRVLEAGRAGQTAESSQSLKLGTAASPSPPMEERGGERRPPESTWLCSGAAGMLAPPGWLASFGKAGTGPGEFNRPEGLCVDAQDRIYVADSCNHRIQIFSGDGQFIRMYGQPGRGKGELSYPYDICVDAAGRQYVCEFGNSRIQVFDANDRPLEIIGGPGAGLGRFSNPWGVALDSAGNLYVADSQNHRVQRLVRR